ncbi:hypothetical protein MUP77_09990 [Candidatus Bathyarchaeota archaeon]|nr:hypothetical protein [Candidatus Bathyarchaeota archaeon]
MSSDRRRPSYAWYGLWTDSEKADFEVEKKARTYPRLPEPESKLPSDVIKYPDYGSKGWANTVLAYCIEEIYNKDRVISARQQEIFHFLRELNEHGYWWQSSVLRAWIHRGMRAGVFTASAEADTQPKVEEGFH